MGQRQRGQRLGALPRDDIEVRRRAANNRAERDHGVVLAGGRVALHDERNLERAGNMTDRYVVAVDSRATQGVERRPEQAFDDKTVEASDHDRDSCFVDDEIAVDLPGVFHNVHPCSV